MSSSILIHSCCAVCASAACERLLQQDYSVTLYFTNSNVAPQEEWLARKNDMAAVASHFNTDFEYEDYDHQDWLQAVSGLEQEPERGKRCRVCFRYRLLRAQKKAKTLGLDNFTTTLTISPHKPAAVIKEEGEKLDGFLFFDFKKKNGFLRSGQLAKELDLYRQHYCGCEFSMQG